MRENLRYYIILTLNGQFLFFAVDRIWGTVVTLLFWKFQSKSTAVKPAVVRLCVNALTFTVIVVKPAASDCGSDCSLTITPIKHTMLIKLLFQVIKVEGITKNFSKDDVMTLMTTLHDNSHGHYTDPQSYSWTTKYLPYHWCGLGTMEAQQWVKKTVTVCSPGI